MNKKEKGIENTWFSSLSVGQYKPKSMSKKGIVAFKDE